MEYCFMGIYVNGLSVKIVDYVRIKMMKNVNTTKMKKYVVNI